MLGTAIQARLLAVHDLEAELGGDDDLVTERREGFAHQFFVGESAIDFSGIEECDAAFDGSPD